jgi:hypothetical protein
MRDDFGVFVLTHGRPEEVSITLKALAKAHYTGKWWLVLDDEDATADAYREKWGAHRVLTFTKDDAAQDMADNGGEGRSRGVIVYARNAVERLAERLGLRYYLQLDDDYTYFAHRYVPPGTSKLTYAYATNLDAVLEAYVDLLEDTGALTVAMAQGGDFLGGLAGGLWEQVVRRKAMNTFVSRVGRPIGFVGRLNEDVNTYVWRGSQGEMLFTTTKFAIDQTQTQKAGGGMSGAYADTGTYVKSFYSVLFMPSAVTLRTMGRSARRIHHSIRWNNAVPKIVSGAHRKPRAGV